MTKTQSNTINGLASFCNNIGKLSIGRSTRFVSPMDGSRYGKVTCTSVGERPRKFMVSGSEIIPNGTGYTYKTIMSNLFRNVTL